MNAEFAREHSGCSAFPGTQRRASVPLGFENKGLAGRHPDAPVFPA